MKTKLLVYTILVASLSVALVKAQVPYSSNATYEMAAADLRSAPARQYNFSKAVMSDVMRLMAEDAGISFFGLPDGGDGAAERMVTFTINAAPFTALETLAKANGVSLIHENGIWYLRPANDGELIGRIYEINYNAQELVRKNGQGGSVGGSSGGSGSGSGSSPGISLQGAPDFFEVEPSRLLEDIKGILDIQTTGANATIAQTASVDTLAQLSLRGLQNQPGIVAAQPQGGGDGGDSQAKVIWNSDSNSLYVVASRQQHQWIEAYLSSADQEQTMIAVEIKFLETNKNPQCDVGIDWSGALGQSGLGAGLSNATGGIDLANIGNYSLPTAVLSYNDLNLRLRSLYNDSNTKSVSYPRMVTLDNREVSFRSVVNQPVLSSSASASLGAGATQTSSIEYIPVGTVINLLPKTMNNGKILLNVSVTVSEIVGTEVINGNPFPIASSRVYTAPLTVKSGYTVAISGLDSAKTEHIESGVPLLGKLPVLGGAFKFKQKSKQRQHLMMLITPVIINGCGVTKKPITKDPWCGPCAEVYPAKGGLSSAPQTRVNKNSRTTTQTRKTNRSFGKSSANVQETAYASAVPVNSTPGYASTPVTPPASSVAAPRVTEPVRVQPPAQPEGPDPKIVEINTRINSLRADLEKTPATDKEKINQVVNESKTLLSQIEAMRGSDSSSMTGELGDTWWSVIKLKTDAVKMSRE
ncbi:MAG: hypothetical protein P1U89_23770 [Verrucomicrobiales bacterium]|nr:hypothetical protein [Verrucomicrobiales bacterium]